MAESETRVDGGISEDEHGNGRGVTKGTLEDMLRRIVLLISFGPGVLGFLWLIGRILRR